jgi:phenylpropionate dioxygenase-like ring-hydroxylating dioxygenase large terminal subunit
MWIWEEGTKNWYTPEEFEENMLQDKTIKFYETTIFRIADPILALKQADDSIEASRKRREEFSLKILRYYQQLK